MGARLSKVLISSKMPFPVSARSSRQPTHDEISTFLASFLPLSPRPRDVEYHYHIPRQYIRPKPTAIPPTSAAPLADIGGTVVASSAPAASGILPHATEASASAPLSPLPPLPNTTPVSHVTLSIIPAASFYTSLTALVPNDPRRAAPIAFIHRPWGLDRRALPRGITVLSSHTGFDECLTVGWNVQLAKRLGVNVGDMGTDGVMGQKCVCLQGYKGDATRKIGLVGGLGAGGVSLEGVKEDEIRSKVDAKDEEGGVRLDVAASTTIDLANIREAHEAAETTLAVMLSRMNTEFEGIGEVFDFTSPLYEDTDFGPKAANNKPPPAIDTASPTQPAAINTAESTLPDPAQTTETDHPRPKRQKKAKKPKAPPPPPLPSSIPLASSSSSPFLPSKDATVTAIAIMNAFHAEEVERAVVAAKSGGWITWGSQVAKAAPDDRTEAGGGAVGDSAADTKEKQGDEANGAEVAEQLVQDLTGIPSQTLPPAQSIDQPDPQAHAGRLLILTGAPRALGLAHVAKYYASLITVVCVGHSACEEWGIRFLAAECRARWPGLDIREVYEEQGKTEEV